MGGFVECNIGTKMKIGVIIPDRGDRPKFLKNCERMIDVQTIHPDQIVVVDDAPLSDKPDITWRYRRGYDALRNKNLDCILFIENDDWYHPTYIETMVKEWEKQGRPDLLGQTYTIYYHIKLMKHFTFYHCERSSAMNTLIRPDLNFEWCPDDEVYTDLHLWQLTNLNPTLGRNAKLRGVVFTPERHICMGIKHGVGLCGGKNHFNKLHRYQEDTIKLNEVMDEESFNFYTNYFKNP